MNEASAAIHSPISLYIHLPWCLHKCAYCDFNSHATELDSLPEQSYLQALLTDLQQATKTIVQREVRSIFIGGGTPSLFSPASIEKILVACKESTSLNSDCEITLETNPGTFEHQKFSEFLAAGVNRLSIGVQSLNNKHLNSLERIHNSQEAISAIQSAAKIGFSNINADLMFGLPKQSINDALQDIQTLCEQPLTHISYYQLTLEPNTLFHRFPPDLPDEDITWTIQNNGMEVLAKHGFERYEVSAYAHDNLQCLHNINYWQFGDYLGIGAGAHSKLSTANGIIRFQRVRQPSSYMQAVSTGSHIIQEHYIDSESLIFEFMLNNLRLRRGFKAQAFTYFTGLEWSVVKPRILAFIEDGLLEKSHDYYRASPMGYRFLDEVTQRFLPAA